MKLIYARDYFYLSSQAAVTQQSLLRHRHAALFWARQTRQHLRMKDTEQQADACPPAALPHSTCREGSQISAQAGARPTLPAPCGQHRAALRCWRTANRQFLQGRELGSCIYLTTPVPTEQKNGKMWRSPYCVCSSHIDSKLLCALRITHLRVSGIGLLPFKENSNPRRNAFSQP